MDIFSKIDTLINIIEEYLEKGERKIIDTFDPKEKAQKEREVRNQAPAAFPLSYSPGGEKEEASKHGLHPESIDFHTGNVRYAPGNEVENKESKNYGKQKDYPTYSEHVIIHGGKPIGMISVHHQHPSVHNRAQNKLGYSFENSIDIHAPSIHPSGHSVIRGKAKEYLASKAFREQVDAHNEEKHGYEKPKFWMAGKKKPDKGD